MKNLMSFYYKLYPQYIHFDKNNYYFSFDGYNYIFKIFDRNLEEQKQVYMFYEQLSAQRLPVHKIILNSDNNIITEYNGLPYVLMKYENNQKKIDVRDIIELQRQRMSNKDMNHKLWIQKWTTKIDYFEYQVSEISQENPYVYHSFNYYLGIWENGVSYLGSVLNQYKPTSLDTICVNHKRLSTKDGYESFFDPVNMVIDHKTRDISEYLKFAFLEGLNYMEILEIYLSYSNLSQYGAGLLFSRLLFPSFYFDVFQEIVERRREVEDLFPYFDVVDKYELFLKDIYIHLYDLYKIEPIEWIMRKKKDNSHELS